MAGRPVLRHRWYAVIDFGFDNLKPQLSLLPWFLQFRHLSVDRVGRQMLKGELKRSAKISS